MEDYHVAVGETVSFSKTVGETDVYMFAGITGDFSGNHVNEEYMKQSRYGKRIAHGALMVGYMSTTSTMISRCERGFPSCRYSFITRHSRISNGSLPIHSCTNSGIL